MLKNDSAVRALEFPLPLPRPPKKKTIHNYLNFLEPQVERGISARSGIWVPTDTAKKVCQRLLDQDSSLR